MGFLNFAHGQMYMIGGFVVYYVYAVFGLNYFVALVACALTLFVIGVLFERLFFRRVLRIATREENSMLLAVGTALLLENVALSLFGEKQRGVPPIVTGVYRIFGAYPAREPASGAGDLARADRRPAAVRAVHQARACDARGRPGQGGELR